jgi:DNA repair protein RadC
MFDTKMHFKSFIEIGVGSVNASVIDRRGIAQKVLMLNATAFILVHNHPSGDPTPSVTDISAAKTISEIGDLIDVPFKDMTILGNDNYTSLKQEGYF